MGPIDLIRKNSRKLKRKLSKHDSSVPDRVETVPNVKLYSKNVKNSSTHSLSFDLSSIDRYDYYDTPHDIHNNSNNNNSLYMNELGFHSVQNLSSYGKRNSIDHLGDLIEVPKNRSLSPIKRDRKSFDVLLYQQLNNNGANTNRRVSSDSTVHSYTKKRPTSLIIDNRKTKFYIPNNHGYHDDTSVLYKNSSVSKSSNSLDSMLLNDKGILRVNRTNKNNKLISQNSKINIMGKPFNHSQKQKYVNNRKERYSQQSMLSNNHGTVKQNIKDINTFPSLTKFNILFAIIYHIFDILFSFFIYIPIFIIFKMGRGTYILLLLFGFMWYTDNWPTLNMNSVNQSPTALLKIQA